MPLLQYQEACTSIKDRYPSVAHFSDLKALAETVDLHPATLTELARVLGLRCPLYDVVPAADISFQSGTLATLVISAARAAPEEEDKEKLAWLAYVLGIDILTIVCVCDLLGLETPLLRTFYPAYNLQKPSTGAYRSDKPCRQMYAFETTYAVGFHYRFCKTAAERDVLARRYGIQSHAKLFNLASRSAARFFKE